MAFHPKVLFSSYQGAFFKKGGGEIQLEESLISLKKKGLSIEKFDMWAPQKKIDILHHFSSIEGAELVINPYKELNKKIALSTILWPTGTKYDHWSKERINLLFNKCDILFTNSDAESKLLSEFYNIPLNKFFKTRNGIKSSFLELGNKDLFKQKFGIQDDFILTIANIDRRKNTDKLVRACKNLGLKIVSIGHIKDHEYFSTFKDDYDHFIHLGPEDDVEILKSACMGCSLFVLPSICETPGLAALEAAAQNAKILITEVGAASEYFKDFATYINPFEEESIVKGIEEELNKKRRKGELREHVINNFTWDQTADDIIAGYKKI